MKMDSFDRKRHSIEKYINKARKQEEKGDGKRWPGCVAIDRGCFTARVIHSTFISVRKIESALQGINGLIVSTKRQAEIVDRLNEIASALHAQPTTGENIEEVLVGGLYWFPTDIWEENIVVPVLVKGVHNDEADVETVFEYDQERDDCLSVSCERLFRTKQAALVYLSKINPNSQPEAPTFINNEQANG